MVPTSDSNGHCDGREKFAKLRGGDWTLELQLELCRCCNFLRRDLSLVHSSKDLLSCGSIGGI